MSPAPHADRDHSESPALTTGMFDTFVRPCLDCGTTFHVVGGKTQPHDCADLPERERVAYAWWQGYDTAKEAADAEQAELRAEVAALTGENRSMAAWVWSHLSRAEAAEAERDRARSLAAALEARLAQVEALHVPCSEHPTCADDDNFCHECGQDSPCTTARFLHPEESA